MDLTFIMVFKNSAGRITDIREATWDQFFRADGSFRADARKLIHNNIKENGSFEFGPKEI